MAPFCSYPQQYHLVGELPSVFFVPASRENQFTLLASWDFEGSAVDNRRLLLPCLCLGLV